MHWSIEQSNYDNDSRVRSSRRGSRFVEINKSRMIGTIRVSYFDDDDEEIEETYDVPIEFVVCPLCNGKGTHVNPSIDCNGLTREDFDADPDFAEDYFSGRYDQVCNECHGDRVVADINEDKLTPAIRESLERERLEREADDEYAAECRYERRMGY